MKFIKNIAMPLTALFIFSSCNAQIPNAKTEAIIVYGNCGMCEKTIEKAAFKKGEAKADWDQDTKMAQITFDTSKTNADAVLQRIAAAGYDSEKFTAPDDVYANLPGCCQYERPKKTEAPLRTAEIDTIEKSSAVTVVLRWSNFSGHKTLLNLCIDEKTNYDYREKTSAAIRCRI